MHLEISAAPPATLTRPTSTSKDQPTNLSTERPVTLHTHAHSIRNPPTFLPGGFLRNAHHQGLQPRAYQVEVCACH